jgi:hypothetical protein
MSEPRTPTPKYQRVAYRDTFWGVSIVSDTDPQAPADTAQRFTTHLFGRWLPLYDIWGHSSDKSSYVLETEDGRYLLLHDWTMTAADAYGIMHPVVEQEFEDRDTAIMALRLL